jgi:hypothetical protein
MTSRTSKQVPRKAMIVSTAFTGIAMSAALFAPAANAQTAREDALGAALSVRWTSGKNCKNFSNWFHLYISHGGVACMGGHGFYVWDSPRWAAVGFCGGNNKGYFEGYSPSYNKWYSYEPFGHGTTEYKFSGNEKKFPYGKVMVSLVSFISWSGPDGCPY